MVAVFEPTTIRGMTLKNRLVRSATWEGMAEPDGAVNDRLIDLYQRLARGGVGLIISSYLYIQPEGKQYGGQIGVHSDHLVPGLSRLARAVHEAGGTIAAQIVHCGAQTTRAVAGVQPMGPSAVESPGYREVPRALTLDEIQGIVEAFGKAAARVKAAEFDGVQLHGAHGYLLSQFLSPLRNRRTDRYGGSLENRARLTLEVYDAVRAAVGPDYPVMIKINGSEFLEGGADERDAAYLSRALAERGIDAIEVSGGAPGSPTRGAARPNIATRADEAYFRPQCEVIRREVPGVPLMLVGGLRSLEVIEEILGSGVADYASLCRPLIREPDLPSRWQRGDRRRAACISCRGCFVPARKGEGLRCTELDRGDRRRSGESTR